MYSSSLLSMMIHSLPPLVNGEAFEPRSEWSGLPPIFPRPTEELWIPNAHHLADWFQWLLDSYGPHTQWAHIPVVVQGEWDTLRNLQTRVMQSEDYREGVGGFIWGRFRLDELIKHFVAGGSSTPAESEYLDLGTPVRAISSTGSTSMVANPKCLSLLGRTPDPANATVSAAIVDLGVAAKSASWPEDYSNKLHHVPYGAAVDLSPHAESVLEVLLDRLDSVPAPAGGLKMLDITTVSMALVLNPTHNQVRASKGCFDQHCAPEMLTALTNMCSLLNSNSLPAVINLSLGTHVGPHNGDSPLERYISKTIFKPCERFLFAAAGNEGGKGISSRLELERGTTDFMTLKVDAACTDLLVEFWWDDSSSPAVGIGAVTEGSGFSTSRVSLGGGLTGVATTQTLMPTSSGQRPPVTFFSLLESRAHGSMSCIAFAMTRPAAGPALEVSFDLEAASADVVVHAWIVISDAAMETHFTQGGPDGTVAAPASDPTIVSVAGYDRALGKMWRHSSRGPSSEYSPGSRTESPRMAHLVEQAGSGAAAEGTSFASPRAAADATRSLADPTVLAKCTEGDKLIEQTYGATAISNWNKRSGLTCRNS